MGILGKDKFKPTVFVGLGGNGGKIVNLLASKLRRHPHWNRIAPMTSFLAIDTNMDDLQKHKHIPADCRFLMSAFDRREYIARKRGLREQTEDKLVTQWVPNDYQFRGAQGAGAGQIRIESRLGLYYNLEDDVRAGLRRKLVRMLEEATGRENPWRENEDRVIQVVLYCSVAGGTGSGGFLPLAYLLRDAVIDNGWGRPNVVGVLTLPTTFLGKVKPELHADIMANGYAALKELEYLTRQLGYEGGCKEVEFHYDPGCREVSRQRVDERPFSLCYLVDRPDRVSIERYEHAVADASFLQIFSPLLGAQAGEYDNYDKHQKKLANGHFSVHFAAFGTALLHLPRQDLIKYSSLRFVARAFKEYLCFGGDNPDFRVAFGDPVWEQQDKTTKDRDIDDKFLAYVAWRAVDEHRSNVKGVFTQIAANRGKDGLDIDEAFASRLAALYETTGEKITIADIERQSISEANPSIERPLSNLRADYSTSHQAVRAFLETQIADLKNGRFFSSFFADLEVNPVAQRYFLVKLLRTGFIPPTKEEDDGFLSEPGASRREIDSASVQDTKTRIHGQMQRALSKGLIGRMLDRENSEFNAAKGQAIRLYEDLAQEYRQDLRRYFWRTFEGELKNVAGTLLTTFRNVAQLADRAARDTQDQCERFRADPGADPDSDIAQYYLDAEALRDDRRGERMWDVFYDHKLDIAANFDSARIFETVTQSFTPVRDPDGRLRDRDASEVVETVRTQLEVQGRQAFAKALEAMHLNLSVALDLEQRYIALREGGQDLAELRRSGKMDDAVRGVPQPRVAAGIEDRLKRVVDECVLLAHMDASKRDDDRIKPADVFLAGLHPAFDTDEANSLGRIIRQVAAKVSFVEGWNEPDQLVLYRAQLGVPVYWFRNVQAVLYPAYKRVRDDSTRSYPLHIESSWEGGGLPDLDPLEIRRAEERRSKEDEARSARDQRMLRIQAFERANLFGGITEDAAGYRWNSSGFGGVLGKDRASSFAAFEALKPGLRADVDDEAARQWSALRVDTGSRARLRGELAALGERLKRAYGQANAEGRSAEAGFIEDEREALATLLALAQD